MAKKSKAELAFEEKVQYAIDHGDFQLLTEVGTWYEGYLNLIKPIDQVEIER